MRSAASARRRWSADFDGYVLPAQDALDLQDCALDDCDVNLSAGADRSASAPSTGAAPAGGRA